LGWPGCPARWPPAGFCGRKSADSRDAEAGHGLHMQATDEWLDRVLTVSSAAELFAP